MNSNKAIEIKNKSAKIYFILAIVFVVVFTTITVLSLFVSSLNF